MRVPGRADQLFLCVPSRLEGKAGQFTIEDLQSRVTLPCTVQNTLFVMTRNTLSYLQSNFAFSQVYNIGTSG